MQIIYTPKAKEHLDFWIKTGNKPILKKIVLFTNAIVENPFVGIGKPELCMSLGINKMHRRSKTLLLVLANPNP